MFDNLSTSIIEASEEDLLAASGTAKPVKTSKKSDDSSSEDEGKEDKGEGKVKPAKKTTPSSRKDNTATEDVSELSEKTLDAAAGTEDDDDEDQDDDTDDNSQNDDDDDNDENTDGKDDDNEDDEQDDDTDDTPAFLKARAKLLISSGNWADVKDFDKIEWTEEVFEEIELEQREFQKEKLKAEILDEFGPYGRKIAEYAQNGGDSEKLIDIFKEQQKVVSLSIDTEEAQKAVVFKHQTEFIGKTPESANRYIKSLIADKELEAEAKESKTLMEADLKAQEAEEIEAQREAKEEYEKTQEANLKAFSSNVISEVNKRTDITPDEKQSIIKVLTKFDKKLQNGTKVNDFYFKFAEFRKDLPNYIDLVRFVNDPVKFRKALANTGKTEQTKKAFEMIRTNNQKRKGVSSGSGKSDEGKGKFRLL